MNIKEMISGHGDLCANTLFHRKAVRKMKHGLVIFDFYKLFFIY